MLDTRAPCSRLLVWFRVVLALALVVPPPGTQAQAPPIALPPTLPGGIPLPALPQHLQQDIIQRIIEAQQGRQPAPLPAAPAPGLPPPPAPLAEEALSPAENFFAVRIEPGPGGALRQFGYETFRGLPVGATPAGALPETYLLGRDDELLITLRGRARQSYAARINRDGLLVVPDLPPMAAAGRTLREFRVELEQRVARDLQSEVFVSIGQVRQLSVFVGGEVFRPGFQTLTGLSTLLDALASAGGVRRTGSLRAIRIEGAGAARTLDLYPLLAGQGDAPDLTLRPGERIVVPPVGGLVAIGGDVSRPAIYELPARTTVIPLAEALELAGGALRPTGNRYLTQATDGAGRRAFQEIGPATTIRRGDAITVQPAADVQAGVVRLSGHVMVNSLRAAGGARSLRRLVSDPRLLRPDPYPRYAAIWRADARTRARTLVAVDVGAVLAGGRDVTLQDGDDVILLSSDDIAFLSSAPVQRALRGEPPAAAAASAAITPQAAPPCTALLRVAVAAAVAPLRFAHARGAGLPEFGAVDCPPVFVEHPDLLPALLDASVLMLGDVRRPGLYPITEDTGLDQVLAVAGGVTETADLSQIELTREPAGGRQPVSRGTLDIRSRNFAAVRLSPRDALRIPRAFGDRDTGPILLVGEFVRPGTYDIRRGERLSDMIARAGGLTPQAYPYGAVFTRESVRARQQEGFARAARELEANLIQVAAAQASAGGTTGRSGLDLGEAVRAGRELASSLREARAAGRMVIEANPVVLAARPELDVLLEPGDIIAIPKRPNEVTVVGSVLNAGSLQFVSGWRAADYVRAAGGAQRFADVSRGFVVQPNGSSTPAGLSAWRAGGPPIAPGSLIVVPQDPAPYETWGFIRDLTSVLAQISVSTAALAVISRESRVR